jgi:TolA-binding protein
VLLSSTISYAPAVQTDPKEFEAKRKEFVTLVDKITREAKLGESPTIEELQRIKYLIPYSPKKYKGNIVFEVAKTMPSKGKKINIAYLRNFIVDQKMLGADPDNIADIIIKPIGVFKEIPGVDKPGIIAEFPEKLPIEKPSSELIKQLQQLPIDIQYQLPRIIKNEAASTKEIEKITGPANTTEKKKAIQTIADNYEYIKNNLIPVIPVSEQIPQIVTDSILALKLNPETRALVFPDNFRQIAQEPVSHLIDNNINDLQRIRDYLRPIAKNLNLGEKFAENTSQFVFKNFDLLKKNMTSVVLVSKYDKNNPEKPLLAIMPPPVDYSDMPEPIDKPALEMLESKIKKVSDEILFKELNNYIYLIYVTEKQLKSAKVRLEIHKNQLRETHKKIKSLGLKPPVPTTKKSELVIAKSVEELETDTHAEKLFKRLNNLKYEISNIEKQLKQAEDRLNFYKKQLHHIQLEIKKRGLKPPVPTKKLRKTQNIYKKQYDAIKKHILDKNLKLVDPTNEKLDAASKNDLTETLNRFNNTFGKPAEEILNDLLIPVNLIQKYYDFLMIGQNSEAYKTFKRGGKNYPESKKMARNILANIIIEKYIDEDLKNVSEQKKYFEILLHKFMPNAKDPIIGYNPEKIEIIILDIASWLSKQLELFKKLELSQQPYLILEVDKNANKTMIKNKVEKLLSYYEPSSFTTEEMRKIALEIQELIKNAEQSMIDKLKSAQPVGSGSTVIVPGAPAVAPLVPGAPLVAPEVSVEGAKEEEPEFIEGDL